MATSKPALPLLQQHIWHGRLPLEIRLARDESRQYASTPPYVTAVPRLSYLPLLLPRLHRYFGPSLIADAAAVAPDEGHFTHDGVPLKWHLPVGLLYDMYVLAVQDPAAPPTDSLPLALTLHFKPPAAATSPEAALINPSPVVLHDAFINSLKEADFVRSGTAKPIMSLPTSESKALWTSTQANDLAVWARVHASLLPKPGQWRGIPLRLFLPVLDPDTAGDDDGDDDDDDNDDDHDKKPKPTAQIRVVQAHIPPTTATTTTTTSAASTATAAAAARAPAGAGQQDQTLGSALNALLPSLFPSRRTAVLARPILHGVPVPLSAHLEDLARWCCYADGWLAVVVGVTG